MSLSRGPDQKSMVFNVLGFTSQLCRRDDAKDAAFAKGGWPQLKCSRG